mgnify:CR=1 FL=1
MGIEQIVNDIRSADGRITDEALAAAEDMGVLIVSGTENGISVGGIFRIEFETVDDLYVMSDGSVTQLPTKDARYIILPSEDVNPKTGEMQQIFIVDSGRDDDEMIRAASFEGRSRDGAPTGGLILMIPEMSAQADQAA